MNFYVWPYSIPDHSIKSYSHFFVSASDYIEMDFITIFFKSLFYFRLNVAWFKKLHDIFCNLVVLTRKIKASRTPTTSSPTATPTSFFGATSTFEIKLNPWFCFY